MSQPYRPPELGEVRGPWRTSPGNHLPWMAYCYGANGWVPFHSKTEREALEKAQAYSAKRYPKEQK